MSPDHSTPPPLIWPRLQLKQTSPKPLTPPMHSHSCTQKPTNPPLILQVSQPKSPKTLPPSLRPKHSTHYLHHISSPHPNPSSSRITPSTSPTPTPAYVASHRSNTHLLAHHHPKALNGALDLLSLSWWWRYAGHHWGELSVVTSHVYTVRLLRILLVSISVK